MVKRAVSVLLLFAFIVFLARMYGGNLLPEGDAAPSWRLPVADGTSRWLSDGDLAGQVIILDFWSVTCPPCIRQSKVLDDVLRRYAPQGVSVVGVATNGETIEEIRQFAQAHHVDYTLVADDEQATMSRQYNVSVLPTLYIIDPHGKIAAAHQGFWDKKSLVNELKDILGQ